MADSSLTSRKDRLLIVDDELSIRQVLAEGLEGGGYETEMAADADEAFARVRQGGITLVLSDIDMPGRSGVELLRDVKTYDDDIDVIMVTGVVDIATALKTIREGASDYLTKPFNLQEVAFVVGRTIRQRQLILENRAYQLHLEDLVEERTRELEDSYEATLTALVTALDFRDNETQGHSTRVVEYATLVAEKLGVTEPDLGWIRKGSILHDVGKIGVPDAILRKPGRLTDEEWVEMKKHPAMGYRMLEHISFLAPALPIVLSHQERFDGSGYPDGLESDEIPLGARIFAVVDTFDAMTSDRPYRAAMSIDDACEEIRRCAGSQFDPAVAEAFLSIPREVWHEVRERVHDEVTGLDETVRRTMN